MNKNKKFVIGFTGHIHAGKTSCCQHVISKFGQQNVFYTRFSDPLRKILNILHQNDQRENMQRLSTILRKEFGQDLLAQIIYEQIVSEVNKVVTVDSIRMVIDIKFIKRIPNFYLVSVNAVPEIRYQRLIRHKENTGDEFKSFEQFLKEEKQESESQILEVMRMADFHIINNTDNIENLYDQLDEILRQILSN